MELIKLPVEEFAALTGSDAPAPGGGSVSALCGALAAALGEMVARLTAGKEKYAASQQEMEALIGELPPLRKRLLLAVDEDTRAFDEYMKALSLPKSTEEEKALRKAAMQDGLRAAARVPLSAAETAAALFPYLEKALTLGNPNAVTDGMVAVMLARTCVLGTVFNVRVNLGSIDDPAFCEKAAEKCDALQALAEGEEHRILSKISLSHM